MKKRRSKKETAAQRREQLLKEKLKAQLRRLSRLEKKIADLKAQTDNGKSRRA
jgi:phage-related minor tail protein